MNISEDLALNPVTIIKLSGRMDIAGVGKIEIPFVGMSAAPRKSIVVDMSEVSYISSIGIRLLISTTKAVSQRGGKLALLNCQPEVKMVIEISGLDKILVNYTQIDDAVTNVS